MCKRSIPCMLVKMLKCVYVCIFATGFGKSPQLCTHKIKNTVHNSVV